MLASDFQSEYGIRLRDASITGSEFRDYLTGLLHTDSRLWRHFSRDIDAPEDDD